MKSIVVNSNQTDEGVEAAVTIKGTMTISEALVHIATVKQALSQTLVNLAKQLENAAVKKEGKK